jgi:hypothetical protein
MRDFEIRLPEADLAEENEIQIERPWSAGIWASAAAFALDGEQEVEERSRVELGSSDERGVQEGWCIRRRGGRGSRLEIRGNPHRGQRAGIREAAHRMIEVRASVALVAAEGDGRGAQRYSIHRTGRTPPPVPMPSGRGPSRSSRPASA